jgi:hypothetical protein
MTDSNSLEQLLRESIQAQNRTTHAVRALATFILIQIAWGLLGYFLIGIGLGMTSSAQDGTGFTVFGWILILIGFVHAFSRAMTELALSKVGFSASSNSNSQSSEETEASSEQAASSGLDPDDWVNAQRLFDWRQMKLWEKAGRPSIKAWDADGRPELEAWIASRKP